MSLFQFKGSIPASKSLLNRALLVQSYFPDLQISGDSHCNDVVHMKEALRQLSLNQEIHCGEAGTVFRFMALRAAREPGHHLLKGSPRLLQRPHEGITFLLSQLSVRAEMTLSGMSILSEGWKRPLIPINIHREHSRPRCQWRAVEYRR